MTIREELKEIHELIQKSYGFGEIFFRGSFLYNIERLKKIMTYYSTEFPNLKYHVEEHHIRLVHASSDNIKSIAEVNGNNTDFEIQNDYLNEAKSNAARGYWSFIKFVDDKRDGFLDKPFDENQFIS